MSYQDELKLFGESCRSYLLNAAIKSSVLKDKLTFRQHIKICNDIQKLSGEEAIELLLGEGIREFEGVFRKFLKYTFAVIAAGAAGPAAPFLGPFVLYHWRKLNDQCYRRCFGQFGRGIHRKVCKYECQLKSSQQIARRLRSEFTKCNQLEDKKAQKCEKKLRRELVKWEKKVQQQRTRLEKARNELEEKERKAKEKELAKRAKKMAKKRVAFEESVSVEREIVLKVIKNSSLIRERLSFIEHLKFYNAVKTLDENKISILFKTLFEADEAPTVEPPKTNPKTDRYIRAALYLGLWVVPVPFFNDVVNYIIKKHDFECMRKCVTKADRSFCYNQCRYLGRKYAVKFLNGQLQKCKKAKSPFKCKKKVLSLLEDWRQREVEARHKYEESLKKRLRKIKAAQAARD
jgi:hypothetical protein